MSKGIGQRTDPWITTSYWTPTGLHVPGQYAQQYDTYIQNPVILAEVTEQVNF